MPGGRGSNESPRDGLRAQIFDGQGISQEVQTCQWLVRREVFPAHIHQVTSATESDEQEIRRGKLRCRRQPCQCDRDIGCPIPVRVKQHLIANNPRLGVVRTA